MCIFKSVDSILLLRGYNPRRSGRFNYRLIVDKISGEVVSFFKAAGGVIVSENMDNCLLEDAISMRQVNSPEKSVLEVSFTDEIKGEVVTIEIYDHSTSLPELVERHDDIIAGDISFEVDNDVHYSIVVVHDLCPYPIYASESLNNICEISYELDFDVTPGKCYWKTDLLTLLT